MSLLPARLAQIRRKRKGFAKSGEKTPEKKGPSAGAGSAVGRARKAPGAAGLAAGGAQSAVGRDQEAARKAQRQVRTRRRRL